MSRETLEVRRSKEPESMSSKELELTQRRGLSTKANEEELQRYKEELSKRDWHVHVVDAGDGYIL